MFQPYPYEGWSRHVAHLLKNGDRPTAEACALEMCAGLTPNDILVPMPGHDGYPAQMIVLADAIAQQTGCTVHPLLYGNARPSQYYQKQQGLAALEAEEIGFVTLRALRGLRSGRVFIVDNVVDTGNTMRAALACSPGALPLVWATTQTIENYCRMFGIKEKPCS